jgi:hypothetical protein
MSDREGCLCVISLTHGLSLTASLTLWEIIRQANPKAVRIRSLVGMKRSSGENPTDAELRFMIPFIRDQQQVLSGGQGILSYEDQNNPSEGRYNLYKNQDLLSQSNSSGAH